MGVRQTYLYINANINNTKRCPVLLGLAESNEGSCVIIRVSWVVKCYPYSKSYECLHYLSFSNAKEPRSFKNISGDNFTFLEFLVSQNGGRNKKLIFCFS